MSYSFYRVILFLMCTTVVISGCDKSIVPSDFNYTSEIPDLSGTWYGSRYNANDTISKTMAVFEWRSINSLYIDNTLDATNLSIQNCLNNRICEIRKDGKFLAFIAFSSGFNSAIVLDTSGQSSTLSRGVEYQDVPLTVKNLSGGYTGYVIHFRSLSDFNISSSSVNISGNRVALSENNGSNIYQGSVIQKTDGSGWFESALADNAITFSMAMYLTPETSLLASASSNGRGGCNAISNCYYTVWERKP